MNTVQNEDIFKSLLETLFENSTYDNLISLLEDNTIDSKLAPDFAEELIKYEDSIQTIFGVNFIDIDFSTLNIRTNATVFNNVRLALNFIKKLSAENFERLCAVYLNFLGCSNPNITKRSHDQGIDFVGVIESTTKIYAKSTCVPSVYFMGQAKHYAEERVSSKEVRELAGSLYLLKHQNFALLGQPYKNLVNKIKAFTPIYTYFITSNYFSQAAKILCSNSDIIPVDRILLSITFGLDPEYRSQYNEFSEDMLFEKIQAINTIK